MTTARIIGLILPTLALAGLALAIWLAARENRNEKKQST